MPKGSKNTNRKEQIVPCWRHVPIACLLPACNHSPALASRPRAEARAELDALSAGTRGVEGAERWCDTAWPCWGLAEQGSVGTHCLSLCRALLKLPSCFPTGTPGLLHQSINTEQEVLISCTFVWFKTRSLYSLKLPCCAGAPTACPVTCM